MRALRHGAPSESLPIVMIGFMGAGKSTVGRLLAGRLGRAFADNDQVIEQRTGRAVREIFADDGETTFREVEHSVIADLLRDRELVLALGGGAVHDERTRELLADTRVIYLRTSFAQALGRVGDDPGRPMLHRPGLELLYRERLALYESLADVVLDTDGRPVDAIVRAAVEQVSSPSG